MLKNGLAALGAATAGIVVANVVGAPALSLDALRARAEQLVTIGDTPLRNGALDRRRQKNKEEYRLKEKELIELSTDVRKLKDDRVCKEDYVTVHEAAAASGHKVAFDSPC
jgi:uncharacterized membrane protein YecN with MAPEG domain